MSNTKTIIGFLAGSFVGASIAVLFAPASGRDTRKYIRSGTGSNEAETEDQLPISGSQQAGEEKIRSVMHHAKTHANSNI